VARVLKINEFEVTPVTACEACEHDCRDIKIMRNRLTLKSFRYDCKSVEIA